MRCLICRQEKTRTGKFIMPILFIPVPFSIYSIDEVTGEKFLVCPECLAKIKSRKWKGYAAAMSRGARSAVDFYYQNGQLTIDEYEYIKQDIEIDVVRRVLGCEPTFVMPVQDSCVGIDEATKRIVLDKKIVNFSDIETYQVFDKSIEYNVQAPNSTQYNIGTEKGLRRTIVGGILAGPAGAVMGGVTAKHSMVISEGEKSTYNTTEHDFSVLVKLKTFNHGGAIAVHIGNDEVKMNAFVNLIEMIIK